VTIRLISWMSGPGCRIRDFDDAAEVLRRDVLWVGVGGDPATAGLTSLHPAAGRFACACLR
jgi:hypothetical protein